MSMIYMPGTSFYSGRGCEACLVSYRTLASRPPAFYALRGVDVVVVPSSAAQQHNLSAAAFVRELRPHASKLHLAHRVHVKQP